MSAPQIARKIFQAITQDKWLSVEYQNKEGKRTSYWIGVKDIDAKNATLNVEGFHIARQEIASLERIYIASIVNRVQVERRAVFAFDALVPVQGEKQGFMQNYKTRKRRSKNATGKRMRFAPATACS